MAILAYPGSFICVECFQWYDLEDVGDLAFFPTTSVCGKCYRKLYASKLSCFGKLFNPDRPECSRMCPDRKICPQFVKGTVQAMFKVLTPEMRANAITFVRRQKVKPRKRGWSIPFKRNSLIHILFTMATKGCLLSDLEAVCKQAGGTFGYQIQLLRRGYTGPFVWIYREQERKRGTFVSIEMQTPGVDAKRG